jgi:ABC-type phosphate transport system ATPase subunit
VENEEALKSVADQLTIANEGLADVNDQLLTIAQHQAELETALVDKARQMIALDPVASAYVDEVVTRALKRLGAVIIFREIVMVIAAILIILYLTGVIR